MDVKSSLIHKKLTPVLHSRPVNKEVNDDTRNAATDDHNTRNTVTLTSDCLVDSLPPTSISLDALVEEDPVWSHFQRKLNDADWAQFQEYEMAFRSKLATKPLIPGAVFMHPNPHKWWKVVKMISQCYIKEREFNLNGNYKDPT